MSTTVIRSGYDTHVNITYPNAPNGNSKTMRLQNAVIRGLLYMPLAGIRGRTVLSAELTGHVGGVVLSSGQTMTFAPLSESWDAATATWTDQPGILGTGAASFSTGTGVPAGDEFAVDVTTAIQSAATGTPWFGWRVTTTYVGVAELVAFDSAATSWTLTVELSDVPAQPSMLSPNGGVVGRFKPVLSWDFTDLGSGSEQVAAQVQIDPASDGVSPDFDSGILPLSDPALDTATTAFAGGSSAFRVRRKNASGFWSAWSDWAPWTYVPKPDVTLLSPAAGVLWDPTAEILAAVSPATMEAFRVRITAGTDRTNVLYDSFKQPASDASQVAFELPATNADDNRILVDDRNYQLNVRVFDDEDRQATPGDPVYTDLWATFHFDDDLAGTPVATTVAHQVGDSPKVRVTWTRASAADKWIVLCDNQIVATLLPEDTVTGVSTYAWVYDAAAPHTRHVFKVKAIVDGRQSLPGPSSVLTTDVRGLWMMSAAGSVCIDGLDIDGFRALDRRATYSPLRGPDIDIIHGFEGISVDEFNGSIENHDDQSFEDARSVLDAIKGDPVASVRLVWGSKSIPVRLRNLFVLPASDMNAQTMKHNVSFGFWQVGEFGESV